MARVHGKNVNYSINGVSIEDELNSVSMNMNVPESEITSFSDVWQNFLAGKPNINTEIQGTLDPSHGASGGDQTIFEAIGGGPVSTIFDPTGSGPGANDPEYQCTASGLTGALVESYNIELPVGGPATYSATIQHSGATVRAVA